MEDKAITDKSKLLAEQHPLLWAQYSGVNLRAGIPYKLKGYRYQIGITDFEKPKVCIKKGTQVGLTTVFFLYCLWSLIMNRYRQGVLYMMPTADTVQDVARSMFAPIISNSPVLKQYISTDTNENKVVNGRPILFTGSQLIDVGGTGVLEARKLRTFPADIVLRDELDHIPQKAIEQSIQRLNASEFRHEVDIGSPTFPDYGIEAVYNESSQGKFQIKCESCGKHTCIETSFPNSIILKGDRWIRACVHCQNEIFVANGSWEEDVKDHFRTGRWTSSLLHPNANLEEYMRRFHSVDGAKMAEFQRSVLGIGTAESNHQLSEPVIFSRCGGRAIQMYSSVETAMGVDLGNQLHCVIGIKTARDQFHILHIGRYDSYEKLAEIAKRMNVRMAVLDAGGDIHAPRKFQKETPFTTYLCRYSEHQPYEPSWDAKKGTVTANRNEWCDKVHMTFDSDGMITIPSRCPEVSEYAMEMTKTAKLYDENQKTGIVKPRWKKIGADHYFHATLYFLLAASRTSIKRNDGRETVRYPKAKLQYQLT